LPAIIDLYNDLAEQIWNKIVPLLGVHTVMVLVQRALWMTKQKYFDAGAIKVDESGIFFNDLAGMDAEDLKKILEDFFSSLVCILARLVGEEIANKITRKIDFETEKGE